jgi:Dolichyl-phosphate-mannose-protein mannosyltransferase
VTGAAPTAKGEPTPTPPTEGRTPPTEDRTVPTGAWLVAAIFFVALATFGARYGYHRDELYFIEAGRHPSWGYPDQPPLVPLLAAAWDAVVGGRLWLFRILPAATAAALAPLAAATCARLGGAARDRVWAAVLTVVMIITVAVGHLFSTSTFDLTLTVALVLATLRALDDAQPRRWLLVGLLAGVAMQVQLLPAFVLACGLIALLLLGPRAALRSPWPWAAAAIALALAAPYLIWQTRHGWPQLQVAASVAAGHSTSSQPRALIVPLQLVLVGVFLTPVLLVGAWTLARSPALRKRRWLVLAYGLLLVVVTVTGGKPYYATGLVPAVLAAGVAPVRAWIRTRARRATATTCFAAHLVGTAVICLPLSPIGSTGYLIAVAADPDVGETVGWNRFDAQVASAVAAGPTRPTAILTANYGEAGALDLYRRHGGAVPPIFSGHNGYAAWGPPPAATTTVLTVGDLSDADPTAWFAGCRAVGTISTGVHNSENGAPLRLCSDPRRPWPDLWREITHYG